MRHFEESSALLEALQMFTLTSQRINYSASICVTGWRGRAVHLLKTLGKLIMIIGQLLFTLLWQSECVSTENKHSSLANKCRCGFHDGRGEIVLSLSITNDTVFYYFGNLVQSLYSVWYWLLKPISLSSGIWLMILGILLVTRSVFWNDMMYHWTWKAYSWFLQFRNTLRNQLA